MGEHGQTKIMEMLEPYLPRIFPIFPDAVGLYNSGTIPQARAEHDDRAAASVVYSHVWSGFMREFTDEPGFHFLEIRGLKVLNIRDELVIRAKKVDANGRHRNKDTPQQRAFDAQEDIPGLPQVAVRLVVGYQPDAAFSEVERVTVRQAGKNWVAQVIKVEEPPHWIDITPAYELPFGEGRRAFGG